VRIDAHQHFWRFDPVRDPWITDAMIGLRRDFLPGDSQAALRATGIDGVVAVQADPSRHETTFLLDLVAGHAEVLGVVGWVDLLAPDLADQLLEWRRFPKLCGFRHLAQSEPDDFLARPEIARAIAMLAPHDFTFDLLVYPRQLAAAERLVSRCPAVRFVLDHCAKPPIASGEVSAWRDALAPLARHPNVWCKLSGLVTEADWSHWSDDDLTPYLDVAATLFGPDRLLFGSDWPVCLLAASYERVIASVEGWAARLQPRERVQLFGDTAAAVYRLER
jgi:L-fuconolactonase